MERPKFRTKGPERIIQDQLVKFLQARGWHVMETHGNMYQQGFPDLYCVHQNHSQRWVEVKYSEHYKFTPAQLKHFPVINKVAGIWILTGATELEYQKLFQPANWWQFLN